MARTYSVKEIYYTLQGEGANTGRPAVFCRFSGCNLWTGLERDRSEAICQFCDTDFVGVDGPGGGRFEGAAALAEKVRSHWPDSRDGDQGQPLVVCTGGEPLLQVDEALIDAFHRQGLEVAVETNGTQAVPEGIDWVCVSPKAGSERIVDEGDELKLVFPQPALMPADVEHLCFDHYFLQPMDGPDQAANIERAVKFCLDHPKWRLSLQTHKFIGID